MKISVKSIALCGMFVALLIGAQFALAWAPNVEVVTVLLLSFSLYFHKWNGMLVATVFSVVRCVIFGFYPTVIILYIVYYNAFAFLFGTVGEKLGKSLTLIQFIIIIVLTVIMTACFTLLDDVITPVFYGIDFKGYFLASLPFMLTQCISSVVTVTFLLIPLLKAYALIDRTKFEIKK